MQTCSDADPYFIVFSLFCPARTLLIVFLRYSQTLSCDVFDSIEFIFILLCLQRLKTKHSVKISCAIIEVYFETRRKI